MQFKKMTNEEIKYSTDDCIIGPRFIKASDTSTASTSESSVQGINVFKEKDGIKIPIKLEENQFYEVDPNGVILNNRFENWLTITNPSSSDKMWNVCIEVPKYNVQARIGEIEANQGWKQEISMTGTKSNVPITITEVISRNGYAKNTDVPSDLFLDKVGMNILYVSIFVANNSNNTLKEFDLLKKLPATTENLVKVECNSGKIESDKKGIKWRVNAIKPFEKLTLNYQVKIAPVPTIFGDISVVFFFSEVENESIIKKFKASAKIAHFIEVSEQDDHPNIWNCSLRIINRSLFLVNVLAAKLLQKRENEEKLIAESSHLIPLKPCEEKVLVTSVLEDTSRPSLSDQLEVMPEFKFENAKSCSLSLSAKRLEILNISARKTFDVDEIESYKESLFSCTIETQNFSSIPLNHLFFEELIPEGFESGDLTDIELKVADKVLKVRDINTPVASGQQTSPLDSINSEIADLDAKIKTILHNSTNLDKLDKESLSQQIEVLSKDLSLSIEEQEKQASIVKDLEAKLTSLKKIIAEQNEHTDKVAVLKSEIASLGKEFNEQADVLKTIQNQIIVIEKEIKELDEKTTNASDGNSVVEKPKENRMSLLTTQEAQIKERISGIKQQIDEKDQELKELNKDTIGSNDSRSRKGELDDLVKQSDDLTTSLRKANEMLEKATLAIAPLKESYDCFTNLKNNMDLISRRDTLQVQKQKVEILQATKPDLKKARDCFLMDFQKGAKDTLRKQFDAVRVVDEFNNTHLFITLINLGSIASAINSQEKMTISYYIRATRPRHDVDYKFGSSLHYMADVSEGMQKYSIAKEALPKLRMIHERHKMMVGKLIDKQSNESKYFVTLLVKNSGGKPLKNIKIIEVFPGEIEILNAYNQYEEHVLENGNKQIIWLLDQVNSFQECEIGYVVDLHGKEFDLNDSQLCFI